MKQNTDNFQTEKISHTLGDIVTTYLTMNQYQEKRTHTNQFFKGTVKKNVQKT